MKVPQSANTERIGVSVVQLAFQEIGFIFREQPTDDFGVDAHIELVQDGRATGQLIALQIKSGKSWFQETSKNHVVFRDNAPHFAYWLKHSLPVIVVLVHPEAKFACWQVVNHDTATSTGRGWKLEVPLVQTIDEENKNAFRNLVGTTINVEGKYTVLSLRDVSHGLAKRFSANMLIPEGFTRSDILNAIQEFTEDLKGREYYRTELVKKRWEGNPAHVIYLFIYRTLDDVRNTNWICRSLWIDSDLPPEAAPSPLKGEEIGHGIVVDWSDNYEAKRKLAEKHSLNKEDFLDQLNDVLEPMTRMIEQVFDLYQEYESGRMKEGDFSAAMVAFEPEVTALYMKATNIGVPPYECMDLGRRFQSVVAYAHNIVLPFSERGLETWPGEERRRYLMRDAVEKYSSNRKHLNFELEKVR